MEASEQKAQPRRRFIRLGARGSEAIAASVVEDRRITGTIILVCEVMSKPQCEVRNEVLEDQGGFEMCMILVRPKVCDQMLNACGAL